MHRERDFTLSASSLEGELQKKRLHGGCFLIIVLKSEGVRQSLSSGVSVTRKRQGGGFVWRESRGSAVVGV